MRRREERVMAVEVGGMSPSFQAQASHVNEKKASRKGVFGVSDLFILRVSGVT